MTFFPRLPRPAFSQLVFPRMARLPHVRMPVQLPSFGADSQSSARQDPRFTDHAFANASGSRRYKLFIPETRAAEPGLIVMLHGCTQSADDFAAGTRMNEAAARLGWLVAYPQQTAAANVQKCWNWFRPGDQARGRGEPAIVAGLAQAIANEHGVDPRRLFVAGLSAGGAAAAVLAATYPDVFAAAGVHSGLACGSASDVASALAAMRSGAPGGDAGALPLIVVQGDADKTVNPANAAILVRAAVGRADQSLTRSRITGRSTAGRAFTRDRYARPDGRVAIEHWTAHDVGHAWSGGSAAGSYTDPLGIDATDAMLRFFASIG